MRRGKYGLWNRRMDRFSIAVLTALLMLTTTESAMSDDLKVHVDPLTRYIYLTYRVPQSAPDIIRVRCAWSPAGQGNWRPAKVMPFISDTALRLTPDTCWKQWTEEGLLIERRATGLERSVVFNPYPEAQPYGQVDVDFRIRLETLDGQELTTEQTRLQADNTDVIYIEDWSKVLQQGAIATGEDTPSGKWAWRTNQPASAEVTFGNALYGKPAASPLWPLTYPLNLRGWYAIFVCNNPSAGSIDLRLTGDERADRLESPRPHQEVLWAWRCMDYQHLVLKQPHSYRGYTSAHIDYVKLVPLNSELLSSLQAPFEGKRDKIVAGYYEPYSWAFVENVQETLQHRKPLVAFKEAQIQILDTQLSRFGAKAWYESRITDQLVQSTIGDPVPGDPTPTTDNVGRLQQYTNTLQATMQYAQELGMRYHANFGAANAYPGTPLQSEITKAHPEWLRGSFVKYELPEVREYILSIYREVLERGAPGISIDFCRYPDGIDKAETCNEFLRSLRKLADEYGAQRGKRVPILIRFPAKGVHLWERFDYSTWAREGLVDYLCPSNIQGRHAHFDIRPYREAVRGTRCKLLPAADGLNWWLQMPGLFLWRVKEMYEAGVDGIYVYQADARVLGTPDDRRTMCLLGSSAAVKRWWQEDVRLRPQRSKGIYPVPPSYPAEGEGYHEWERLRVWLEGIPWGEVELYLDGKLINRYTKPPYILGSEERDSDRIISPGKHELLIRARDGDGWLEQRFTIVGAK